MKKVLARLGLTLATLVALALILYPPVSDYINSFAQSRAVTHYFDDVDSLGRQERHAMLQAAHEYNIALPKKLTRAEFTEEDFREYFALLDVGQGVMGILAIDKINVSLPIYHGIAEEDLQIGLGHMPGTSLPVGGRGTHSYIAGHRGLPSSKLLSNLDEMELGDIFSILVMGETLIYRIDDIITVLPEEITDLPIDSGQDYCTLVTCTPYGVNSHRLLVRGMRVEVAAPSQWDTIHAGAKRLDKLLVVGIVMIPLTPLVLIIVFLCYRRKLSRLR